MLGRILVRPESRAKSWIKYQPQICEVNRRTYCHVQSNLPGDKLVWTHNGCICNQYIALAYRHQVATPVPNFDESQIKDIFEDLFLKNRVVLRPAKRWKVVNGYSGPYRRKYMEAHKEYHRVGLKSYMSHVTMFCKDDSYSCEPEKAPRAIQYRNTTFALEQGRFTKPIEKWFYHILDDVDTLIVGKSDPFTIAQHLHAKSAKYKNPCFLMLDASKFDSCVDIKWLKLTLGFYKRLYPKRYHRTLDWLWTKTYINVGKTRHGLRYKTWGTRMSGDMDTGLGNSIIMYLMLKSYLKQIDVRGSIMVNGDDSLVVIEQSDVGKAKDISCFKRFGFNMKFDISYSIHQAEFCQSRLFYSDCGPMMALNPQRAIDRAGWTTMKYSKSNARAYINTIGRCNRAAHWGQPILYKLAIKMIEEASTNKEVWLRPYWEEYKQMLGRWWRMGEPAISLESRLSFAEAWNIEVPTQLDLEKRLKVGIIYEPTTKQKSHYNYYV